MDRSIFHPEFKPRPYWWEAIPMGENPVAELPGKADVVIVGGGHTALNCAIELGRNGVRPVVLEAEDFGFGASTRNGGAVSGGVNLGKGMSGAKAGSADPTVQAMIGDAAESFTHIETVIAREGIDCHYQRTGRFVGAFAKKHYDSFAKRVEMLNELADADAALVPRERVREEIATDYYHGGMTIERSGKLHPALYHRGLMAAAERHGATLVGKTRAGRLSRNGSAWTVETSRGTIAANEVVIATNGYTGGLTPDLKRRVIPLASHIIATEPLDPELAKSLIPKGRTISDTPRVLTYYRMSPDGTRVLFGGRARFTPVEPEVSAAALHGMMLARWPQLKGVRVTHGWMGNTAFSFDFLPHMGVTQKGLHYAMGCNGSGVAMLSYLGAQVARKILGGGNSINAFDGRDFPTMPLYTGYPWFLPIIGGWYRFRDWLDRRVA